MFNWLFANKRKSASVTPKSVMSELSMRASIEGKLRNYNADEDTTISEFSLADDDQGIETAGKATTVSDYDVWGQANPKETGKWNKEVRQKRNRAQAGRHSINPRQKNI
ncbi:MAG: hypothetical protein GY896_04415 [Gammaproteobacteria bacterium]|nr:hypothetical protein [Gammaproteobacteria bacterium]